MKKTFTLVEIMIVVGIIGLLATLVVPNIARMRMTAHESAAQVTLQSVSAAAQTYRNSNAAYPSTLQALEKAQPPYITLGLNEKNEKRGYVFVVLATNSGDTFLATAIPSVAGKTGTRSYCVTDDGVLRVDSAGKPIESYSGCTGLPNLE